MKIGLVYECPNCGILNDFEFEESSHVVFTGDKVGICTRCRLVITVELRSQSQEEERILT